MSQVQELLAQKMSRKEFLRFFIMAIMAIFGVTNFLNFIMKNSKKIESANQKAVEQSSAHGFGSRKFGD